jgi:hypothetical protein
MGIASLQPSCELFVISLLQIDTLKSLVESESPVPRQLQQESTGVPGALWKYRFSQSYVAKMAYGSVIANRSVIVERDIMVPPICAQITAMFFDGEYFAWLIPLPLCFSIWPRLGMMSNSQGGDALIDSRIAAEDIGFAYVAAVLVFDFGHDRLQNFEMGRVLPF